MTGIIYLFFIMWFIKAHNSFLSTTKFVSSICNEQALQSFFNIVDADIKTPNTEFIFTGKAINQLHPCTTQKSS